MACQPALPLLSMYIYLDVCQGHTNQATYYVTTTQTQDPINYLVTMMKTRQTLTENPVLSVAIEQSCIFHLHNVQHFIMFKSSSQSLATSSCLPTLYLH